MAVVHLTRQENVSFAQLAKAVNADPALVARLLKLANGCRIAGSRPIVAIQDAVSLLGLTALRGLALGFSLLNNNRSGVCTNFNYPVFWSKNLARAVAMQTLAGVTHILPREESFTLGLLAHMGELGLASVYPEEYSNLLENKPSSMEELSHQEVQLFDIDHADLTAEMLEDWGIPAVLVAPVRCHEKSLAPQLDTNSRSNQLILLLMLSGCIADICLLPENQRQILVTELLSLGRKLAIPPNEVPDLCDHIVRDWSDWCQLFHVQPQSLPPFSELLNSTQSLTESDTEGTTAPPTAEKMRVLVVEDDRSMRGLLKALLARIMPDFDYREAENGRQGLELAMKEHPHLMVIDWFMPEKNGIELIRRLRETEQGRRIYILMLTGMKQDESHFIEAFEAGADDFLTKPIRAKVLAAKIQAGLRIITLNSEIERNQANLKRFASEFSMLTKRLQVVGTRDFLTGVLARSHALDWLRKTVDGLTSPQTISAILIRLDNLREINLTRGQQTGDEILRQIAHLVGDKLGPQQRLARYSGNIFLLLALGMNHSEVGAAAQRISQTITTKSFGQGEDHIALATHVAYAMGQPSEGGIDALLNAAEMHLAELRSRMTSRTSNATEKRK